MGTGLNDQLQRVKHILQTGKNIKCGRITLSDTEEFFCYVRGRKLDLKTVTELDTTWLRENLTDSHFAFNNKNIIDHTVRRSKSIKEFVTNLDIDPLLYSLHLNECKSIPYKFNYYTVGDFFTKHRDSVKEGQIGTLILIPYTEYTGGEIVFTGLEETPLNPKCNQNELAFVYFDINIEHEVRAVLSGSRISMIFNIFKTTPPPGYTIQHDRVIDNFTEFISVFKEYYDKKHNILLPCGSLMPELENQILSLYPLIEVKFNPEEDEPKYVYNTIGFMNIIDSSKYEEDEYSFNDIEEELTEEHPEQVFRVNYHFLDLLSEKTDSIEMKYYQGYYGNSTIEHMYKIKYRSGYLLNPE